MRLMPRDFDPASQASYADSFRNDDSGLVTGLQFRATLLPRTPKWILEHHGEIWRDRVTDPPNYGTAADGIWIASLPWRDEPGSTGPLEFDQRVILEFYKAFRTIIESTRSARERYDLVAALVAEDPRHRHIVDYYRLDLPCSFFAARLMQLDGVGPRIADSLLSADILEPEAVARTPDSILLSVPGIGSVTLARIRASAFHPIVYPPAPT